MAAGLLARPDWRDVLISTLVPHLQPSRDSISGTLALLGTTAYVESHFRSTLGILGFLMEIVLAGAVLFATLRIADWWIPAAQQKK